MVMGDCRILFAMMLTVMLSTGGALAGSDGWLIDPGGFHGSAHGQLSCQDCRDRIAGQVHPDPSVVIVGKKIQEALDTEAAAIVTSCRQCVRAMMTHVRRNKIIPKVMDITQLLHRALGG